jgi:hypothetical protein
MIHEADVWQSRFCHIGFDTIARMSKLEFYDTTNIRPGQEPNSCDDPRGWMCPKLESQLGACLCELQQSQKSTISMRQFFRL